MKLNAYPGPVPLDVSNSGRLYGRASDIDRLVNATITRKVVEVTAPSGTGKSSLLMAGVRPALERRGLHVAVLRSWADVSGDDPVAYYAAAVRRAFLESGLQYVTSNDPRADLANVSARYGPELVLLFDQLEELLRLDPALGQRFISTVAFAARELPFRQILSIRSEYKEELDALESDLSRALWTWLRVQPIGADAEREIVARPPFEAGFSVTDEAVDLILSVWRKSVERERSVGLLHLQAMLWVIAEQVGASYGEALDVAALMARSPLFAAVTSRNGDDARPTASTVLHEYTDLYLARLESSNKDSQAARETRFVVAQLVDQLSSAGYKVPRGTNELFLTGFEDIRNMRWNQVGIYRLLSLVSDWYEESGSTRLPQPKDVLSIAESSGVTEELIGGNRELLAGRLVGASVLAALSEAVVAFERAIDWLRQASIVRITKDRERRRIVTLVHDGYGEALNSWADVTMRHPDRYIEASFGVSGRPVLTASVVQSRRIYGLRWPGCYISNAGFKDVHFIDCDFRGAIFDGSSFEDVSFDDCAMSGTLLISCDVRGTSGLTIRNSETRTLTLLDAALGGGGLSLEGSTSDGLFLRSAGEGRWSVRNCAFRHMSVNGGAGPGSIIDSELSHLYIEEGSPPTVVRNSTLRFAEVPRGGLVDSDEDTDT